MLEVIPGLAVTGESSSSTDLIPLIGIAQPDILFIDVHLKKTSCFELTARIHHLYPDIRIILVSMFAEQGYQDDGKLAGASAIIFKPSVGDSIENTLNILFPGEFTPHQTSVSDN